MKLKILRCFAPLSLSFLLFSCVNTKKLNLAWVYKKQIIYEGVTDGTGRNFILKDSITESGIAKITRRDTMVSLILLEGSYTRDTLKKDAPGPVYQGLFFPYMDWKEKYLSIFVGSRKLRYIETSPVLQALTIPLKVRFGQGNVPYEAEPSINFGVAFGWKFTHYVYQNYYHEKSRLFLNRSYNHYSLTPGIFVGPGVVELTNKNSNVADDRNVLSFSYGAMLVFGINRLNIGVALGFDNAVANNDKDWIYQSKAWLGATITLDLIQ
jgi:hypothetical protein